ncbi:MAG: nitroreductase family protein [archaeon GB-1867-005]|nr:nitroreductase family protein [Candidatus Culexmicrobium cathedralense]
MEFMQVVNERASVRMFTQEEVNEEDLKKILNAAIRAPTAFGAEQWFFIVVKSKELRMKIHELMLKAHLEYYEKARLKRISEAGRKKLIERFASGLHLAPIYIAVYADLTNRVLQDEYKWLEETLAEQSACAAIENMILAAHSLGYGTCWIGLALLVENKLKELLKPPENSKLITIISLGKPAGEIKPKPRKQLEEVVKII